MDNPAIFLYYLLMVAVPAYVRTSGLITGDPYHSTPGTKAGDIMLTLFLNGRGIYRIGNRTFDVYGGMAGLVKAEGAPGILMSDPQAPYTHRYCRFNGYYAEHLADLILRREKNRFFQIDNLPLAWALLEEMGRNHFGDEAVTCRTDMGLLEANLLKALVLIKDRRGTGEEHRLTMARIRQYLQERLGTICSIDAAARHFSVSRSTLCRFISAHNADGLQAMHEAMKIEWAQTLLSEGRLNVSETGLRLGYSDPFYFSRVFRKRTGVSPKQWQQGRRVEPAP